jgi:hypothetical protein
MKDLKLKATFVRKTRNGNYAYRVSSLSRDPKTAQAEMDFFHENYTEMSTSGGRDAETFYSPDLYATAELTFDYNVKRDTSYFNLNPPMDFIEKAALQAFTSNVARPVQTRAKVEVEDDADLD